MTTNPKIARARALRRDATPPERQLWRLLKMLRPAGHHFRRQAPFRGYVLDFVCYAARLVVEVDGATHGKAAAMTHDAARDAVLAREGFRTLRFAAADVLRNLEGLASPFVKASRLPTPALPTRGREKQANPRGKHPACLPPPLRGEGRGGGQHLRSNYIHELTTNVIGGIVFDVINTSPAPSLAANFALIIGVLRAAVAARMARPRSVRDLAAWPALLLLWTRLHRLAARFAALAAGGRRRRLQTARAGRPVRLHSRLPRGHGWLIRLLPEAAACGSQLQHLLATPDMTNLLATAPQARRLLRPLCRMLAVPDVAWPPPVAPALPEIAPPPNVALPDLALLHRAPLDRPPSDPAVCVTLRRRTVRVPRRSGGVTSGLARRAQNAG